MHDEGMMQLDGSKMRWYALLLPLSMAGAFMSSCTDRPAEPSVENIAENGRCDVPGVRDIVVQFGERLRDVSLLAHDSVLTAAVRQAYAPLVTDSLLNAWITEPADAPGRDVSSPWPQGIDVRSAEPAGANRCRVEGEIVYVTSADPPGHAAARERVTLQVRRGGEWRISGFEIAAEANAAAPAVVTAKAADVLRRYYAAIDARDYRRAYELWGNRGEASGQTFEAFATGFAETAHVDVEIGRPGRIEAAAGSRYVKVPVIIQSITTDGEEQRFEGTYTLRRGVVEGASAEVRRWHIYDASIVPVL